MKAGIKKAVFHGFFLTIIIRKIKNNLAFSFCMSIRFVCTAPIMIYVGNRKIRFFHHILVYVGMPSYNLYSFLLQYK